MSIIDTVLSATGPAGVLINALRKYWLHILIVVMVLTILAIVYHEGGRGPRAEFKEFRAKVEKERAEQELADVADQAASEEFVFNLNRAHSDEITHMDANWAAELKRVQQRSGVKPAPKPVQSPPRVCSDEAGNNRLSNALEIYRREVRASVEDFRSEVGRGRQEVIRLLAACEKQSLGLEQAYEWAQHEHTLWGEDGKQIHLQ